MTDDEAVDFGESIIKQMLKEGKLKTKVSPEKLSMLELTLELTFGDLLSAISTAAFTAAQQATKH